MESKQSGDVNEFRRQNSKTSGPLKHLHFVWPTSVKRPQSSKCPGYLANAEQSKQEIRLF